MSADAAPAGLDDGALRPLPHLSPVLVVDEGEADELLRTARAGIAMLSLQLRSLPTPGPAGPVERDPADSGAAEVLLRTSLEQSVEGRRIELRDELEQVRADAAAHVAAARHEAATIVAGATEATLQVLLGDVRPAPSGPNLRVVTDDHPRRPPLPTLDHEGEPVLEHRRADSAAAPAAESERAPAGHPASNLGGAALEGSVTRAVSAALAEVFAAGQAALAPPTAAASPAPRPAAATTVLVPAVPSPADEPVPAATAASAPRSGLRRFLYADVLLPMVAVLIVLVILLAWVG